jgi:HEAT repeat protein
VIPYAEIAEAADRRWSFRLLDRLVTPELSSDERDEVVSAMQAVSDRRTVPILGRLLTDRSRPTATREAAGEILRGMQYLDIEWPDDTLRGWWNGGDAILRRHALLSMDAAACPDIVRAVAADPAHPLRIAALGRMTFFFDSAADLRLKIAALSDPTPAVREAAAAILFWDEPVAAEEQLIAAASDAVEEVAAEAIATLQYYPTTRVIRCLHGLLGHPAERVRNVARGSLDDIRHECLLGVLDRNPRVADRVRCWLAPVWNLLAFTPEELSPSAEDPYGPSSTQKTRPPILSEMLGLLTDPDTSPKVIEETLWAAGWDQYPAADRSRLRPVLLNHDDPLVRERAAVPLQEWADADGLLALAGDPGFGVRKSAFYRLGLLPADRRIAAVAWDHLHRPDVFGVHARETLGTFVAHAEPADAIPRLTTIAADRHRPEGLRVAAVHDLARLGAANEVSRLLDLLDEPPAVTWALQIAVLDAAADMSLPSPDAGHLAGLDSLHVQAAAGRAGLPLSSCSEMRLRHERS